MNPKSVVVLRHHGNSGSIGEEQDEKISDFNSWNPKTCNREINVQAYRHRITKIDDIINNYHGFEVKVEVLPVLPTLEDVVAEPGPYKHDHTSKFLKTS